MCLAFPAKIVAINDDHAVVDFGAGVVRDDINISLLESVDVGDYVLIHAGYAIQILDMEEAQRVIKYWKDNLIWKCERCSIAYECPLGSIALQHMGKNTSGLNDG
jgi:hydrogenase expression/formation protein HypC